MLDFFKKKYNLGWLVLRLQSYASSFYIQSLQYIMRPIFHTIFCFILLATHLVAPISARADTSSLFTEVQTALKIIGFMQGVKTSAQNEINIKIVFDPESSESKSSAIKIQEIINNSPIIKKRKIIPSLSSINTPLGFSQIYIVAPNTSRGYNVIKKQSLQNKSATISIGSDCARKNICGLAVEKKQAIKIYLNESIFDLSAYDLDSTLRYLAVKL